MNNDKDFLIEKLKRFSKACEDAKNSTKETLRILESLNENGRN